MTATSADDGTSPRLVQLLVATALAVYLLVVVGAATALLDGGSACGTWPTCDGRWLPASTDLALLAAWGHRLVALLAGGLLAATAAVAWRGGAQRRVGGAIAAAAVLYPGQIALGALAATLGATTALASAHLVVGVAIFAAAMVALLWQLEGATPGGIPAAASAESPGTAPGEEPAGTDAGTAGTPEPAATGADGSAATGADGSAASGADGSTARGADGSTASAPAGVLARGWAHVSPYVRLTKPKLWWLLCLVALAAMALAGGPSLDAGTVVATLTGGVLAIGASGTFNNVLERDVDRKMARTDDRPVVAGQVPVGRAVAFGVALTLASVGVFLAFVNALAAALGLLAVLYYSVGYTLVLKPNTDQNIVVGGAVGAFPALIGWAAVTDTVGMPAIVLGAVVFLWTPAHFYNLALVYRDDYARAGFPMLPVVRGAATTRRHVLLYFGATMVGAVALGTASRLGWLYAGAVVAVAAVFVRELVRQYRSPSDRTAMRTFHASNAYLGVLLAAVLVDALVL